MVSRWNLLLWSEIPARKYHIFYGSCWDVPEGGSDVCWASTGQQARCRLSCTASRAVSRPVSFTLLDRKIVALPSLYRRHGGLTAKVEVPRSHSVSLRTWLSLSLLPLPVPLFRRECTGLLFLSEAPFVPPIPHIFILLWSWETQVTDTGAAAVSFSPCQETEEGAWQLAFPALIAGASLKQSPFFLLVKCLGSTAASELCCAVTPQEGFPSAVQIDHYDCLEMELGTSR